MMERWKKADKQLKQMCVHWCDCWTVTDICMQRLEHLSHFSFGAAGQALKQIYFN